MKQNLGKQRLAEMQALADANAKGLNARAHQEPIDPVVAEIRKNREADNLAYVITTALALAALYGIFYWATHL